MLLSKALVTDLTQYERKTLLNFFGLYVGTVTILLAFIIVLFFKTNYQNTHENLIANMKMQAQKTATEIIVNDMKGVKKEHFIFPSSTTFAIEYLKRNQTPSWCASTETKCLWEDKKTNTISYIDKSAAGHYGVYSILIKDSEFLDDIKRYTHCAMLFGSIYVGVLLVGYILARIFITPIVLQRKQLNNFIRDTTHELNTPISAIVLSIDDDDTTITEKSLLRIKYSVKRIAEIYGDLTYLFLEDSALRDTSFVAKHDIKNILEAQMFYFTQMAEKKEQKLIVDLDEVVCKIDKEDFSRLVNNLITNAIKYTPKNGTIKISLTNEMLCVEDNGVGIKEVEQEKIFERFYRASSDIGGFGIGLSIVKNIVQKYGFTINIKSKPDVGTVFTILF